MSGSGKEDYHPSEQDEILDTFREMLRLATADGGNKRAAGEKPNWKIDPSHLPAIFSHLNKYFQGETEDADSGAHPLVHMAWRCLALAWQEETAKQFADVWSTYGSAPVSHSPIDKETTSQDDALPQASQPSYPSDC